MTLLIAIILLAILSFVIRISPLATPVSLRDSLLIRVMAKQLPTVLMILLLLSSLKSSQPLPPQIVGIAITAIVHLWRRQSLLSIASGMTVYILMSEFSAE